MKKLIAILLVLLLTASLFAGCKDEKTLDTTAAPAAETAARYQSEPASTEAPATESPATETPAAAESTEPESSSAPVPVEADGVKLLKEAAEKMTALNSLGFRLEFLEEITSESISMGISLKADGAATTDPKATHLKGSMSVLGMEFPMEEYSFAKDNTLVRYEWDEEEQSFLRSESEPEEADPDETPAAPDYDALEISTAKDGSEYVLTVNAGPEQFAALFQVVGGFLNGSNSTDMLSSLSELTDAGDEEELANMRFPLIFRIDEASGRMTCFTLDLDALFAALLAAHGEDATADGSVGGHLSLYYFDFDAVEPIVAPTEYKVQENPEDWEDANFRPLW